MRTILYLLQKEFLQIFRNKAMLPIITVMPIVQLLILSFAANYEIKNMNIAIVDQDLSPYSKRLSQKMVASGYFRLAYQSMNADEAYEELASDRADLVMVIPRHFERDLIKHDESSIQLLVNAINGTKAGLANGYANVIIQQFNNEIRTEWFALDPKDGPAHFEITFSNWYNQGMNYRIFMVPGLLVVLVTMIGAFLSGMNIVKEKEIGTIEQLNVTPIRKSHFIIGKLLPFWLIGLLEMAVGLMVGKIVFDIPFLGSIGLLFLFSGIYLWVMLGLGLLISTFTETQQQAMFISWFFMVIFILMSGLFTPIESMPGWAQKMTLFNPLMYFVKVIRMVLLKGSGWAQVQWFFGVMVLFAIAMNTVAVLNYRKTV
ncbi:ABC-2 type transport system permease protein [Chitinophaga skermanii]|uniref:ABC-2 type transport system permease protein n=1 Tax=Chitinophaga skermanii TaxID=331697 RepID=A0A327QX24_9BACT|nr:ABC transporter permease [Chitinophaga skermanii]RAJ08910.1 ABC-2 type transport system permease protein [Chitinophaga skermanii]